MAQVTNDLPKLVTPTFMGTIPSTNKSFEFRPFLVGEQKVLLFAFETGDMEQIYLALKRIIGTCAQPPGSIDIDVIPSFDAESIFLQLASRSIGEVSDIQIACDSCEKYTPIKLPLGKAKVKNFDPKKQIIKLTDKIGLKLKYSSIKEFLNILDENTNEEGKVSETETIYSIFQRTIESIFTEDKVFPIEDYTEADLTAFIESMSIPQIRMIEDFIAETPYLAIDVEFTCPHCKAKNSKELRGIKNFFWSPSHMIRSRIITTSTFC